MTLFGNSGMAIQCVIALAATDADVYRSGTFQHLAMVEYGTIRVHVPLQIATATIDPGVAPKLTR